MGGLTPDTLTLIHIYSLFTRVPEMLALSIKGNGDQHELAFKIGETVRSVVHKIMDMAINKIDTLTKYTPFLRIIRLHFTVWDYLI